MQRRSRLEARRDRLKRRLRERREGAGDQGVSLGGRIAYGALRRRYEHVRATTSRLREREQQRKAAANEEDPYDLARYDAAWWPVVRKLRPDTVHAFDVSGLSVARRAGRRGARWIYEAHEPKRHCGDGARRRQVTEHALHADGVIAATALLGEIVMRELELPHMPALVHTTPPLQAGPAPHPSLREAAGVGDHDPLLVLTGVLTRRRRVDVVLEAMTMLPDVRLALVVSSTDPLTSELLALAEELAVSDRVRVVPKVPPESVVPYVADANVGVIPFVRTPGQDLALPNKLFEYLHAGLPIVVSDATTMADFVRRHGLGEVAPLDDARAWAQAIERALQPPYYRDRASQWAALKEEWCWERQAERLVGVYRDVLESR
jgi:glycosyltransferase involved in cell wall biosynthesis